MINRYQQRFMDACEECFSLAFFPKRFSTWSPSHPTKSRHTKPRPARSSQEPGTPGQNIFEMPVIATATVFQVHLVFEKYWIMIWDYLTIWDASKTNRYLRVSIMWDCGETGVYPESIQIRNLIIRFPRHKKGPPIWIQNHLMPTQRSTMPLCPTIDSNRG